MRRNMNAIHLPSLLHPKWVSTLLKCHTLPYGPCEPRFLFKSMLLVGLISWPGGREEGPFRPYIHKDLTSRPGALPPSEAAHTLTGTQRGLKAVHHSTWICKIYTTCTMLLWHFFIFFNVLGTSKMLVVRLSLHPEEARVCVCVCVVFLQCTFS